MNLRGMGAARTLVLLNGRRHVSTETLGVDISAFPISAIGRVEVLKDGAAAVYGSDAIAGVANFITRSDFQGLEIGGSFKDIDNSDGDWDINSSKPEIKIINHNLGAFLILDKPNLLANIDKSIPLGTYEISYQATDSSGSKSEILSQFIKIEDSLFI